MGDVVRLLQSTDPIEVVGTAFDGPRVLEICQETWPDIVVLALELPVVDGVKTIEALLEQDARLGIVLMAATPSDDYARQALKQGARAYLLNRQVATQLPAAIHQVFAGHIYLPAELVARLGHSPAGYDQPVSEV